MTDTAESLRHKISSAGDLQSVVRSMKALAASNIVEYERSVNSVTDYYRAVELGLGACFRERETWGSIAERNSGQTDAYSVGAVIFGSDQGLVGQFNEVIANFAVKTLSALPGKSQVWAIGEQVQTLLEDSDLQVVGLFAVPNSVKAITPLIGRIQIESEAQRYKGECSHVYVFHNRPTKSGMLYEPVSQRLLPLDAAWQQGIINVRWPTANLPEVMCGGDITMSALIREYLFISLFRACAESLASENASRLAAMGRAEKNISELLENLNGTLHRVRQSSIDEELFDVISGSEALNSVK